ncbi:MAG TPA: SRPBCC family protein [Acidimicrobiia bacterium]|nr:SRPBCC family protein [Acidimicrobiia bacterium]
MQFEHDETINAPADVVWAAYADVERWPDWADSFRSVRYVEGDALVLGARVRIEQPKLPKAEWTVTDVQPGRAWTWVSKAPGIETTAVHDVIAGGAQTRVHTTITQRGPLGAVFGRLYAKLTRSYMAMEGAGLKRRSEARASA